MNVNNTIPFIVVKNILNDIKTSFLNFVHNPDPDNSTNSLVWMFILLTSTSFVLTFIEAFYGVPFTIGKNHIYMFFNNGFESVLFWCLTFLISLLVSLIIYWIFLFIRYIMSLYIDHYYEKYGEPSKEIIDYNSK